MKRKRLTMKKSKRMFRKAGKVNKRNTSPRPMRGGIRL